MLVIVATTNKSILLLAARLTVDAGRGGSISCKIVLDSESQRSYVTRVVTKLVNAEIIHQERLKMGSGHSSRKNV